MYFQGEDEMPVMMRESNARESAESSAYISAKSSVHESAEIDAPDILLGDYRPVSTLKLKRDIPARSKYPAINVHCHLGAATAGNVADGIAAMDATNTLAIVNLDGGLTFECTCRAIDALDRAYPGRFYTFLNVESPDIGEASFSSKIKVRIKASAGYGAKGIKLFKEMGLVVRDSAGSLILPDDDRLRHVWESASENKLPVLYHIADPAAFFQPFGPSNERFEQLRRHPAWRFCQPQYPGYDRLIEAMVNLLDRNPSTTFIFPHVASLVEDLPTLSDILDRYANCYFDISARIYEFARMPFSGRDFLIRYADRALYGTDGDNIGGHPISYRVLETNDEYFNPRDGTDIMGPNARFMGYGLKLPDDVLEKIYFGNARRLLSI